ncbi:MAG: uncharacterized protein JWM05_2830 [Acidimicrobiales bacterium]|nr:uncharacterized protein [Acidimicrobiales bacterium]
MGTQRGGRVLLVAGLVAISFVAGCVQHEEQTRATSSSAAPTSSKREDFVAQPRDFVNLHRMTAIRGFFIANRLGHLAQALAVARSTTGGTYPVGTIVQLVPQEAMVKRASGFSPRTNDWEFFALETNAAGTTIRARGGAKVVNRFGGGSCAGCHQAAEPKFDFICEHSHGCAPLPFGDDVLRSIQKADPRPV